MKSLAAIILFTFNICLVLWIYDLYTVEESVDFNMEIKELKETQERWIEHTELLIIIDRLSFSLQSVELNNKELVDTLNEVIKQNQQLKCLLQNENQSIFKSDKST